MQLTIKSQGMQVIQFLKMLSEKSFCSCWCHILSLYEYVSVIAMSLYNFVFAICIVTWKF